LKVYLTLLVCTSSLIVLPALAQTDKALAQTDQGKRELPSLTLLGNESRKLLRQEAVLKSGPEKDAAATALCDMYVILRLDSRYGGSKMLQGDATQIRRRLISIAKRNEKTLNREGVPRPPNLSSEVSASISAAIQKHQNKTASNDAEEHSPAAGQHSGIADGDNSGNANDHTQSSQSDDQATDPNPAAGQNAQGAQAAGGIPDTDWQLVELIQRVIAPDFWESRGGPGSIRYFAMRRVLVIRATTDIHEQVRDLLTALR
jgi:hypothetical protein